MGMKTLDLIDGREAWSCCVWMARVGSKKAGLRGEIMNDADELDGPKNIDAIEELEKKYGIEVIV